MSDLLIKMPLVYEPLRQNRFLLRFPSDLGIQEWWVKDTVRPTLELPSKEIEFMNTSTWITGRYKWKAMTVKLRDTIGPSTSQAVMEWVRLHAESVTGRMGYAAGYKRNCELEMLDPTGVVVQKWILVNCMLSGDINFGSLSYTSEEIAEIDFSIQPDYCVLAY